MTRYYELTEIINSLLAGRPLADEIQNFWYHPLHRHKSTWVDHSDINTAMLATCLAPEGYLQA